jgi:hypothetical protein
MTIADTDPPLCLTGLTTTATGQMRTIAGAGSKARQQQR